MHVSTYYREMGLGKSLRLRRIFANGRALIVPVDHGLDGPIHLVRMLARSSVDAVILSPGVLEHVAEELGTLAVILRLNAAGGAFRMQRLASAQGAMELGAEAIVLKVDTQDARELDHFGMVAEEARRCGMPVIADVLGEHLETAVCIAAEYGADAVQMELPKSADFRHIARGAGRPVLVSMGCIGPTEDLFRATDQCLAAGVQGIVVEHCTETVLTTMHALLHQGVSVEAVASNPRLS